MILLWWFVDGYMQIDRIIVSGDVQRSDQAVCGLHSDNSDTSSTRERALSDCEIS
jgi:hypothetical protein